MVAAARTAMVEATMVMDPSSDISESAAQVNLDPSLRVLGAAEQSWHVLEVPAHSIMESEQALDEEQEAPAATWVSAVWAETRAMVARAKMVFIVRC